MTISQAVSVNSGRILPLTRVPRPWQKQWPQSAPSNGRLRGAFGNPIHLGLGLIAMASISALKLAETGRHLYSLG